MKPALVILSTEINQNTLEFLEDKKLKEYFDTYIVVDFLEDVDSYTVNNARALNNTRIVTMSEKKCVQFGYKNSMYIPGKTHINKEVVALDKALYYFCKVNTEHEYVWLIEDDVFIPSVEAMIKLDRECGEYDLCTASHKCKMDKVMDWHWPEIVKHNNPPFFYSMSCAIRLSREMLYAIKVNVGRNNSLFFNEVMFNTLAHKNGFRIFTPPELRSIVWQGEFGLDDFLILPNSLFHPVKKNHKAIRQILNDIHNYEDYIPANKLPNFLKQILHE